MSWGTLACRLSHPNLQYHFAPILAIDKYDGAQMALEPGFQMQVDQLRPRSRGAVTLQSADPLAAPTCRFNYFADGRDMAEMVDGYRTAMELLSQPALDPFRGQAALAAASVTAAAAVPGLSESDAEIERFVRGSSGTDYHPCGTCKMGGGADGHAVVDSQLRVHGVQGLRVVDASVMPAIPSGDTKTRAHTLECRCTRRV